MKTTVSVYASLNERFNPETCQAEEEVKFSIKTNAYDDWSKNYYLKEGSVWVGDLEVGFPTDHITLADVKQGMVAGLREKMVEIKAEAEQACTTIQAKINTLLALTYVEPDQGGEFAKRKRDNSGAEDAFPF